jgi:hypothetical protein
MLYPLSYRGGAGAKVGENPLVPLVPATWTDCRGRFTIRVRFPQADSDAAAPISMMRARRSGSCRAASPQAAAWVVGGSLLRPR